MTTMTVPQGITALLDSFASAQSGTDANQLGELLADDFMLVGPLGYVVNREAWLDQYRSGALKYGAFELQDPQVRMYGSSAIVIANQLQQATYQERDASGQFRLTLIAVLQDDGWRVAGLHLSPMPPSSPPGTSPEH